jgi:hypothetical protein
MNGPILIIRLELEGEESVVSGSLHTPHSIWLHLILSSLQILILDTSIRLRLFILSWYLSILVISGLLVLLYVIFK